VVFIHSSQYNNDEGADGESVATGEKKQVIKLIFNVSNDIRHSVAGMALSETLYAHKRHEADKRQKLRENDLMESTPVFGRNPLIPINNVKNYNREVNLRSCKKNKVENKKKCRNIIKKNNNNRKKILFLTSKHDCNFKK
jgi:hypothetical protein